MHIIFHLAKPILTEGEIFQGNETRNHLLHPYFPISSHCKQSLFTTN